MKRCEVVESGERCRWKKHLTRAVLQFKDTVCRFCQKINKRGKQKSKALKKKEFTKEISRCNSPI